MNPRKKNLVLAALLFAALPACRKPAEQAVPYSVKDTEMVPSEEVADYPVSSNDNLAHLGRVLFYDKQLSLNRNISCGSCHKQANAFTDNKRFSEGTDQVLTRRNTPAIFSRFGRLFWDGRSSSLHDLALRPVQDRHEMGIDNVGKLVGRISSIDYYQPLIQRTFGDRPLDSNMIKSALAEFMRNFVFTDHKFRQVVEGRASFTQQEEHGRELFFGKALCSTCHNITSSNTTGAYYGTTDESHNIGLDILDKDKGVGAITRIASQDGAFMTPVLINVELTAPYMHDGRFNTLEEVIEHYSDNIKDNPNLDNRLRGYTGKPVRLNLTDSEKASLVAFLKTLTDRTLLEDKRLSDPFVPRSM